MIATHAPDSSDASSGHGKDAHIDTTLPLDLSAGATIPLAAPTGAFLGADEWNSASATTDAWYGPGGLFNFATSATDSAAVAPLASGDVVLLAEDVSSSASSAKSAAHGHGAVSVSAEPAPLGHNDDLINVNTGDGGPLTDDASSNVASLGDGASSWHGLHNVSIDAAFQADNDDLIHFTANDDPIWFNDTGDALQAVDGSVSSDAADLVDGTGLGSFHPGSSGMIVADLGAASSSHTEAIDAPSGTIPLVNSQHLPDSDLGSFFTPSSSRIWSRIA